MRSREAQAASAAWEGLLESVTIFEPSALMGSTVLPSETVAGTVSSLMTQAGHFGTFATQT